MSAPPDRRPSNRLAGESSPYLLSHAHNPVDWYPWGREALERAEREHRPILLSVGYSACHWCHVMERESFSDEAIARLMNEHFVCIKVDREERPDLDQIYMAATVALSGAGGWPMTVFLTPEQQPFFAGTYFPPEDAMGRPGFATVLQRIAELWQQQRELLLRQAAEVTAHISRQARDGSSMAVGVQSIDAAVRWLDDAFDPEHGGFGQAPKFPAPASLSLLLRQHRRTGEPKALEMVTTTLDAMASGGIRDHVGGGFARYSTDERWLVPHFEKMLYDNAALGRIYAEAFQVTGIGRYEQVVRETLDYVLREMRSPEGGFYSATDADSEGVEGKYFVWTPAEVQAVLPADEARAFCAFYDISAEGNWEGLSIPNAPRPLREVARELGCSVGELEQRLGRARAAIYATRQQRVPPACDDKILCAWNGLMLGTLAECARLLGEPRYLAAAVAAADFVLARMVRPDGGLFRTFRQGRASLDGYLEDYAMLCDALLDLYEAGGGARWLGRAAELGRRMAHDFHDGGHGAFFATAHTHERLLMRRREAEDGSIPSANAVAARALTRLSFHCDRPELRQLAADAIAALGRTMARAPQAFVSSLCALDLLLEGPVEVVLCGGEGDPGLAALGRELARHYLPNRIVVHHDPEHPTADTGEALVRDRGRIDGRAAAYVCRQGACLAPVTEPRALGEAVERASQQALLARQTALAVRRLPGSASSEGTRRYLARVGAARGPNATVELGRTGYAVGRFGFGGYRVDDESPVHAAALERALLGGCNLVDTSSNYTDGGSERLIGQVLGELSAAGRLARDEVVVVSKVGYLQGANLELAEERERAGQGFSEIVRYTDDCWHCIHRSFLAEQLERSLERLGLETIDVLLLHNPEYFFSDALRRGRKVDEALRELFYQRIERAFGFLEERVRAGRIHFYGVSSNSLASRDREPDATSPARMLAAAERAGGQDHHFAVLQLPLNLLESNAVLVPTVDGKRSVLDFARDNKLGVLGNRPLNALVDHELARLVDPPTTLTADDVRVHGPELARWLEHARSRARMVHDSIDGLLGAPPVAASEQPLARKVLWALGSTPGLDVVLVGMRTPAYVEDALTVLGWPAAQEPSRLYRALRELDFSTPGRNAG